MPDNNDRAHYYLNDLIIIINRLLINEQYTIPNYFQPFFELESDGIRFNVINGTGSIWPKQMIAFIIH